MRKKMLAVCATLLLALGAAVGPAVSKARPHQCGTFEFYTKSNGCDHERYRYTDGKTGEWIGTVEIIYC